MYNIPENQNEVERNENGDYFYDMLLAERIEERQGYGPGFEFEVRK